MAGWVGKAGDDREGYSGAGGRTLIEASESSQTQGGAVMTANPERVDIVKEGADAMGRVNVLNTYSYKDIADLLASLQSQVIQPAEDEEKRLTS
jgi:hypothetical protein